MKLDILLDNLKNVKVSKIDDWADRLNYVWTPLLLVFFTFGVGLQQTFKEPLNCKIEANFPASWVSYVKNYCYVSGTYHTPMDPDVTPDTPTFNIGYYQWIPYILAAQALSFYLPHWCCLVAANFVSKFDIRKIVNRCHTSAGKKSDEMDKELKDVARTIVGHTTLPHEKKGDGSYNSMGRGLVVVYLACKILNVINIIANLILFVHLIGGGNIWGANEIVKDAFKGVLGQRTSYFPRISFCAVPFKMIGQPNEHVVQCLLMINILSEKVFVILHFWFIAMLALTVFNFVHSSYKILISGEERSWVITKPFFDEHADPSSRGYHRSKLHHSFVSGYLSWNGNLMVRFIEEHAGSLAASKMLYHLSNIWLNGDTPDPVEDKKGGDKEKQK